MNNSDNTDKYAWIEENSCTHVVMNIMLRKIAYQEHFIIMVIRYCSVCACEYRHVILCALLNHLIVSKYMWRVPSPEVHMYMYTCTVHACISCQGKVLGPYSNVWRVLKSGLPCACDSGNYTCTTVASLSIPKFVCALLCQLALYTAVRKHWSCQNLTSAETMCPCTVLVRVGGHSNDENRSLFPRPHPDHIYSFLLHTLSSIKSR